MAQRTKLTNNSDETDIAKLISGDTIFAIPYFQRAYKWKPERLKLLNADILDLVDGTSDFHFLGAVIVHGRRSNPSDPVIYDVIDGQQRITTLFLYLCAAVKSLCSLGEYSEAAAIFLKFLVINRDTGSLSNYKIQSCKDDRSQLNNVYLDLLSDSKFKEKLSGFKPRMLPATGKDTGPLRNNYRATIKFFRDESDEGGLERVRAIYGSLLNQMSVVQIDVWDPMNGPKIFDSLNSRQEPITTGDLIRNEIFSRVADAHSDAIEQIDANHWQPFYKKFELGGRNYFDGYFFPYGLIKRPNLKKSEVYSSLRDDWDEIKDPELIIQQLSEYQDAYLDIQCGTNLSSHSKDTHNAFHRLYESAPPSSTLPFLIQLSKAVSNRKVTDQAAIQTLAVIESFLVRRAVCGFEPTGLHAVFKRLWNDCDTDITATRVIKEISKHKTVTWPSDEEFAKAIKSRSLYGVGITKFLILEFDRSLRGDRPKNVPWIEHVLPNNPDSEWLKFFSPQEHQDLKDLLANLLPLSSEMNISLSNGPYSKKKEIYRTDSMFKSSRQFAETFDIWTPTTLHKRAEHLAAWATKNWPHNKF